MKVEDAILAAISKVAADRMTANLGMTGTFAKLGIGYYLLKNKNSKAKSVGLGVFIDGLEDLAVFGLSRINLGVAQPQNQLNDTI